MATKKTAAKKTAKAAEPVKKRRAKSIPEKASAFVRHEIDYVAEHLAPKALKRSAVTVGKTINKLIRTAEKVILPKKKVRKTAAPAAKEALGTKRRKR